MKQLPTTRMVFPAGLFFGISVFSLTLLGPLGVASSYAVVTPDVFNIPGVVRDFNSSHPDFGITDPSLYGHYAGAVAPQLDLQGQPVFSGFGAEVAQQWFDKDGNPIKPYGDLGLIGGHFDVDVYNSAPSTNETYHEHEFDDKFDLTYVDIVNDWNLLFDNLVGVGYPNDLRVTMLNKHNGGGGWVTFQADGDEERTYTSNWMDRTFSPSQLKQFRVDMVSLDDMRPTQPGVSQGDAIDRDDSLSIRMYDVTTDALVYELAVYHHYKAGDPIDTPTIASATGADACGAPLNDTTGSYSSVGDAGITDSRSFRQWFHDAPGANVSELHSIPLTRNGAGEYEYMTDSFFPVDGQLFGNEGALHNELFTYSMSMMFQYNQCTDMFFELESNDDAWVFINGELVLDIGGLATPSKQYVALDRLGLGDGQIYSIEVFYARRRPDPISTFNLRTNIGLLVGEIPTTSALWD